MENAIKYLFLAVVFSLSQTALANDTNYFIDQIGHFDATGKLVITDEQIEEAKHAATSRPADKDPEGNWGKPAAGIQLSVRTDKREFTNGEPITATILVRNVTNKPVSFVNRQLDVLGFDKAGHELLPPGLTPFRRNLAKVKHGSVYEVYIRPAMQRRFDEIYHFTVPGDCHLQVFLKVPTADGTTNVTIKSGNAEFQIKTNKTNTP